MCNLYAPVSSAAEIRRLFAAIERTGNAPWPDKAYPNRLAPVLRRENGEMTLSLARWGLPSPAFALKGKSYDRGVTNVRNLSSPHWRRWLVRSIAALCPSRPLPNRSPVAINGSRQPRVPVSSQVSTFPPGAASAR